MDELMRRLNCRLAQRPDLALWAFGAVMIAVVLIVVLVYRRSRVRQKAREEEIKLAGLSPAELPGPLAEKLRRLNSQRGS